LNENDVSNEQYNAFDHKNINIDSDLGYFEMNIKFDELWILL